MTFIIRASPFIKFTQVFLVELNIHLVLFLYAKIVLIPDVRKKSNTFLLWKERIKISFRTFLFYKSLKPRMVL